MFKVISEVLGLLSVGGRGEGRWCVLAHDGFCRDTPTENAMSAFRTLN